MLSKEEEAIIEEGLAEARKEMEAIPEESLEEKGIVPVDYSAMQKVYNLFLYLVIDKYKLSLMETVWIIFSLKTRFVTQLSVMQSEASARREE